MTRDGNPDPQDAPVYGIGTYVTAVAIGAAYFVLLGYLVSLRATNRWVALWITLVHGGLLSAVTTWIWLPPKLESAPTPRQFTLRGIIAITAVAAISVSYVAQVVRERPDQLELGLIPPVLFYSLLYFVFTLPFATFVGVGLYRIWQILANRTRR